jgi:O-antigen ligase
VSIREIFWLSNLEEKIVGTLIFLFPIFFLTIKGWTNTISFLIFFVSLFYIAKDIRFYICDRGKRFWWIFGALVTPFLAQLIAQLGKGNIVGSSLDGPARFLMAAIAFIYLSRTKISHALLLSAGCILSVFATGVSVMFSQDYYWGDRAATYFVDPITLPCCLIGCVASTGLNRLNQYMGFWATVVVAILTALVAYVIIESQSRSSMIAFLGLILTELYIVAKYGPKSTRISFLVICLLTIFVGLYFSDVVTNRASKTIHEVRLFFSDNINTSSGIRVGLAQMDLLLFVENPVFGVPDGSLPPIEWFSDQGMTITETVYNHKLLTGSHNEILAHLSREGVFGLASVASLFLIPVGVFYKFSSSSSHRLSFAAQAGLTFSVVIFLSGLTIQVFNLKMTSTFYAFVLSILFAQIVSSLDLIKAKNTR